MSTARVEPVSAAALAEAATILRHGGLVVTPSVTNYGLMCDPFDELAIERVFAAKRRTKFGPLTLFVAEPHEAAIYGRIHAKHAEAMAALWPGPVAFIVDRSYPFPRRMTLGAPTISICCQGESSLRRLLDAVGMPLAGTSANLSGQGDIDVDFDKAVADLGGAVDLILDPGDEARRARLPQTHPGNSIVDLTFDRPYLVRHGAVDPARIAEVIPDLVIDLDRYQALLRARIDTVAPA